MANSIDCARPPSRPASIVALRLGNITLQLTASPNSLGHGCHLAIVIGTAAFLDSLLEVHTRTSELECGSTPSGRAQFTARHSKAVASTVYVAALWMSCNTGGYQSRCHPWPSDPIEPDAVVCVLGEIPNKA